MFIIRDHMSKTMKELYSFAEKSPEWNAEMWHIQFTEAVLARMEVLGVDKIKLGAMTGMSKSAITKFFRYSNFSLVTMSKVAMALGLEVKIVVTVKK